MNRTSEIIRAFIQKNAVFVCLVVIILIISIVSPGFLEYRNLINTVRRAAALGILSIGQTVVVVSGGIDLSVAAVMQLAGVTLAEITRGNDTMVVPATLLVVFLGAAIGMFNGFLVAKRNVQPFISTLFVGLLLTGIRLLVTRASPSGVVPPMIRRLGGGSTLFIPNAVLLFAAVVIVVGFILNRTVLGRGFYSTGGNRKVAFLSGLATDRIIIVSYVFSGVLAAIAGVVLIGYLGYADQGIGLGYDLDSIAAVAIGGAVLGGGKGTVSGTVAGVLLMAILLNLVLVLGLRVEFQLVVRGVVIIAAVALHSMTWTRASTRRKGGSEYEEGLTEA